MARSDSIMLRTAAGEELISKRGNAFTVQFHPEACAGPQDSQYLFDKFIELMSNK